MSTYQTQLSSSSEPAETEDADRGGATPTTDTVALLSVSILSANMCSLGDDVERMLRSGVDTVHVDIFDGRFVPSFTFGAPVLQALRKRFAHVRIDCHCCVENPSDWVVPLATAGASTMIFHWEALSSFDERSALAAEIRRAGMRCGVALSPHTEAREVYPLIDAELVDVVLVMTVTPGFGGLPLQLGLLGKVSKLRARYPSECTDLDIIVDGGINVETCVPARRAGASTLVSGSTLFKAKDLKRTVALLKGGAARAASSSSASSAPSPPDWRRAFDSAWRTLPMKHVCVYPDEKKVAEIEGRLRRKPRLVSYHNVCSLKRAIAEAQRGRRFIICGGDCAESFDAYYFSMGNNIQRLAECMKSLKLALAAELGAQNHARPPVLIVRGAGQFAKPRTSPTETRDGITLETFWGDSVNRADFTKEARVPDPERMLMAYDQSSNTLATIEDTLRTETYTAHEALLLHYEAAMTRPCGSGGSGAASSSAAASAPPSGGAASGVYNSSASMIWIGNKTRQLDHAHVEYARHVANPVGVKLSDDIGSGELLKLVTTLNPHNEAGKIVLICRIGVAKGAEAIEARMAEWVAALRENHVRVAWMLDPMHGNTYTTKAGRKTRKLDAINQEISAFARVTRRLGEVFAGVMLEMTGDDVTECIGKNVHSEEGLDRAYRTLCDPRLNPAQATSVIAFLGQELRRAPKHAALIMAKEGSLGLPGKNMETLHGEALVARAVRKCKEAGVFDAGVFVSTNGDAIASAAHEAGATVVRRADALAANDRYVDAVNHAVKVISDAADPTPPASVTIVQCVQPIIEKGLLERMVNLLCARRLDSVVTVSPGPGRIEWLLRPTRTCSADGRIDGFPVHPLRTTRPGSAQGRAADVFEIDNAAVTFSWAAWLAQRSSTPWPYLGHRIYGVTQDRGNANFGCDLNYPDDLEWLHFVKAFPAWQAARWDSGMFSDSLDSLGMRSQVLAPTVTNRPDLKFYGRARTVHIVSEDTDDENIHTGLSFIESLSEGDVLVVDGSARYAYFGELMTRLAVRQRLAGVVIGGLTRDTAYTRASSLPIHALGYSPKDIKGRGAVRSVDEPISVATHCASVTVTSGDYVFGDSDGVVFVPQTMLRETMRLVKAAAVAETDIKRRIALGATVRSILTKHSAF